LNFLTSLQSERYISWNAGGTNHSRISSTITMWRNLNHRITGIQWTSNEGSNHVMCYNILMFNNQEPPQAIGEHVVTVPRLLMAIHNTTDEVF
jgi:hypothetical protein